ncbi:unnamed protein product [Amoebophrya sp. A120]|nr:unnamed protein product [Amoebophrya sp. A120]|eukprot:GSA120T00019088001.1
MRSSLQRAALPFFFFYLPDHQDSFHVVVRADDKNTGDEENVNHRRPFYYWNINSVLNEGYLPENSRVTIDGRIPATDSESDRINLAFHEDPENQFGPCFFQNDTYQSCVSSNTLRACGYRDPEVRAANVETRQRPRSRSGTAATTGGDVSKVLDSVEPSGTATRSTAVVQCPIAAEELQEDDGTSNENAKNAKNPLPVRPLVECSREESDRAEKQLFESDREQFRNAKCTKHWTTDPHTGEPAQQIRCVYEVYSNDTNWTPESSAATIVDSEGNPVSSSKQLPSGKKVKNLPSEQDDGTTTARNDKPTSCRAIPLELLQYVPKCFDWSISGSGWEEHGERQLAWEYASSGRVRSVLEFGGGSGSVSVVLQEGMKTWNRRLKELEKATIVDPAGRRVETSSQEVASRLAKQFQSTRSFGVATDTRIVNQPKHVTYEKQYSVPPKTYLAPVDREIDLRNHIVIQPNAEALNRTDYEGLENLMLDVEADALTRNRRLCNAHYQVVDHSLNPVEADVWILRGMLTEPIDFVMADCEGCLLEEFRKNPNLFDYVKTIVVERDDTLEMAFATSGKAVAHNKTGPYNMLFAHLGMRRKKVLHFGCAGACDVEAWERETLF